MAPEPLRISGLLFDLDGTLIATRRLYLEAFADALEPVVGHRPSHDEMMALRPRAEVRFLRQVTQTAVGNGPHVEAAAEGVLERFFAAYQRRHEKDFEGVYHDVPQMLSHARSTGLPLGLVTGKSRRSWGITSAFVELGPFDPMVFDDDVPRSKPDPTGLRLALEALGTPARETLYVGDSTTDLEAAAHAGVIPVGVLWSKRSHEREPFAEAAREWGGEVLERPGDLAGFLASAAPPRER